VWNFFFHKNLAGLTQRMLQKVWGWASTSINFRVFFPKKLKMFVF
jgi:hypothetical protein